MFCRVKMARADREALRLLWKEDEKDSGHLQILFYAIERVMNNQPLTVADQDQGMKAC